MSPKRRKTIHEDYFETTLKESGIDLAKPPERCVAKYDIIVITRNLKKILQKHSDYPQNLSEFFDNFVERCQDLEMFKHYLFPNIVRKTTEDQSIQCKNDSIVRILLTIPLLQNKLINYIFEKAIDLAADSKCGPWIKMILRSLCTLDNMIDSDNIATNIISLLDVTYEELVQLEIITTIPDIIGDQAHDKIVIELSKILKQKDHKLIPATLDCLSYLCLSNDQYEELRNETLNILKTTANCSYFPNFVKFLLIPGKSSESTHMVAVKGLRNALSWPSSIALPEDIASSQILTAQAIRNTMVSSESIANAWIKLISNCNVHSDHEAFNFIIILILFSLSEEKQKQVEKTMRKQIKLNIFKEDLLDKAFEKYKPIIKEYLKHMILLTNSLLKTPDSMVQSFASHMYTLMFDHLEDSCQTIVVELLQFGLNCKDSLINILAILNNVAAKNMSVLKQQSSQMLTLLDRKDDMTLNEIRAVMNLVCGLAYSYDNSVIRSDVHIIIRKYLGRSNHTIKYHGILAGIHAVKYLIAFTSDEDSDISLPEDINYGSVDCLPEGNLREAAQIIELINCSTREFPKMIAFFYDEFCEIIKSSSHINKHFLKWITLVVTNDLAQNYIVNNLPHESVGELTLCLQYCLNAESEKDDEIAINIAGLTLEEQEDVNILILSPLFQLVQTLDNLEEKDNNSTNIYALIGCPVVMPKVDVEVVRDELTDSSISAILDCLIHCVNWFREVLNAFSAVPEQNLRSKVINRVFHIQQLESLITEILTKSNLTYQPPSWAGHLNTSNEKEKLERTLKKLSVAKRKKKKEGVTDESILPESCKSQATQKKTAGNSKMALTHNIQFRALDIKVIELLNEELTETDFEQALTVKIATFLLSHINKALEKTLHPKLKKNIFSNKQDTTDIYDPVKAEQFAEYVNKIMPKIVEHLTFVTSCLEARMCFNDTDQERDEDDELMYNDELFEYISLLENIFNFLKIYFKWIGFKNRNNPLLQSSLKTLAKLDDETSVTMQDLLTNIAKSLQNYKKYCVFLSTATSLIELLKTLQEHSCNRSILVILRDTAKSFLSKPWKTAEGADEKGVQLNQSIDIFGKVFFENIEIDDIKDCTLSIMNDVEALKKGRSHLNSYKSINKNNFSILFRIIGSSLHDRTKQKVNENLTNSEHLEVWESVLVTLKSMVEITKILEFRNIMVVFFKKSIPVIKLFVTYGIPILQIEFKNNPQRILGIWSVLQKSTRFLQSVCCHLKLKNDKVLMAKIPTVKELLETLIYKVKSVLASNECTEAFEMGNLKNRNIQGEIIASQETVDDVEVQDDCDDHLPDDSDSEDNDLDLGLKSASEMI
ncbi:Fanconi anemia complementation group D2 [Danaus plexippus plexippus]|uniref:Fanconi anemia complementation group D2 n=1 Tax=Danaus plexippus plexippus TaxID=278856 RepID=A0A212EXS5_DANPL|nr:Fanconi anemia complementation group D2 [Danaus plexippus plexippus]